MEKIAKLIRDVPDFPIEGIIFKDITPVLLDHDAFKSVIDLFTDRHRDSGITKVLGIESRGFIFAAPVALNLGAGLIVARKAGKLPWKTVKESYSLEYGTASLEIHEDAIVPGDKVLLIDDLLATGGTMAATANLVKKLGGKVVEILFVIELDFLKGRDKLKDYKVHSLVSY